MHCARAWIHIKYCLLRDAWLWKRKRYFPQHSLWFLLHYCHDTCNGELCKHPYSSWTAFCPKSTYGDSEKHLLSVYIPGSLKWVHKRICLAKFCSAFFEALPVDNYISTTADLSKQRRAEFTHEADRVRYYYTGKEYSESWRAACTTARREILPVASVASTNVFKKKPDFFVPSLPLVPENAFSVLFLGFLIMKVSCISNLSFIL